MSIVVLEGVQGVESGDCLGSNVSTY